MKINPSEPARPAHTPSSSAPTPAPETALGLEGDRLLVSFQAEAAPVVAAGFSWLKAARQWWDGFVKQPVAMVAGVRAHPWRAAAIGVAGGAAILAVPVMLPISLTTLGTVLAVGFGAWGVLNMSLGALAARKAYDAGRYEEAEHAFERIGEGSFNLASAAAPYVSRQVLGLLKTGVTSEAAYAEKLSEGADIVVTKAEGLERAAQTAHEAGQTTQAETLVTASKQLKTYGKALEEQSKALRKGRQTVAGAKVEVQKATQVVQTGGPNGQSTLKMANTSAEKTLYQKLRDQAEQHYHRIRTDKGISHRFQATQRALGLRRIMKILQPFVGVVPNAPLPDQPETK